MPRYGGRIPDKVLQNSRIMDYLAECRKIIPPQDLDINQLLKALLIAMVE